MKGGPWGGMPRVGNGGNMGGEQREQWAIERRRGQSAVGRTEAEL